MRILHRSTSVARRGIAAQAVKGRALGPRTKSQCPVQGTVEILKPEGTAEQTSAGDQPPLPPPGRRCFGGGSSEPNDGQNLWQVFWHSFCAAVLVCVSLALPAPMASAHEVTSSPLDTSLDVSSLSLAGPQAGVADDIETVRRLLRDVFMEQMVLRKRLDAIDPERTGVGSVTEDTAAMALRRHRRFADRAQTYGTALIQHVLETYWCSIGEQNLVPRGMGVRLQTALITSPGTKTHMCARVVCSAADGARLWHAHALRQVRSWLTVMAAPIGARFGDIASGLHATPGAAFRGSAYV
jgi:hypothetical protein